MPERKHDERREFEEEAVEDLDVDDASAEAVRGGHPVKVNINKVKTSDKQYNAAIGLIRG